MQTPGLPDNEARRLTSLRELNILDSRPEERFDRLTRLATKMFDVPVALVSLIDEDRQWFKSSIGIETKEMSRNISFCGHTILENEILLVPDALLDERFSDNPMVTGDPFIRFYAGCPIRHINGSVLGTLCLIDVKPKTMGSDDLEALKDLAELTEYEVGAARLATSDDLTELSNRRGFLSLAEKSLNICARNKSMASLIFLDLNKFKLINDQFGHAEGDVALKAFAENMKEAFRESDVIARLSGDEFVALLTNTSNDEACNIIERFQGLIDNYNEKAQRGYELQFSSGIVTEEITSEVNLESLLDQADKIMYTNKAN